MTCAAPVGRLIISRAVGQSLLLGDHVRIAVEDVGANKFGRWASLVVQCPSELIVIRAELVTPGKRRGDPRLDSPGRETWPFVRAVDQRIAIGDDIDVMVQRICLQGRVRLAIMAPRDLRIRKPEMPQLCEGNHWACSCGTNNNRVRRHCRQCGQSAPLEAAACV